MRIYLSGKITGREKEDYTRQFARAESFYKTGGFDVVNPVKIGEEVLKINPKAEWQDFMIRDLEDFTYEELSDKLQEKAYDFQKGAEFGYKLAHEEIDYLNKHWRSEEERKANEWHKG